MFPSLVLECALQSLSCLPALWENLGEEGLTHSSLLGSLFTDCLAWVRCLHLPVDHKLVSVKQVLGEKSFIKKRPWECHTYPETDKSNALSLLLQTVSGGLLTWIHEDSKGSYVFSTSSAQGFVMSESSSGVLQVLLNILPSSSWLFVVPAILTVNL